ncbi:MAG TPA: PEP/pyruvate-binding domain-containing protein, partial [Candidatus Eisenbacteria bacterium]|nr:PEP/pyruvate-binding domain-containing protein [Candidatus Eisenbacteria bacterium]
AKNGVYIANVFSRDLYLWDTFPDHNDLVRGYVLEQYFVATNPTHKFAELRAFGGLSGTEYETGASAQFFERYLTAPEFNDSRDFLLAYELQKRFFLHADLGQIEKIRAIAVRVQAADPRFKPLRDAVHNQMSARLIPDLAAYRDKLPPGPTRAQVDEMIAEITKLTSADESALVRQVGELQDATVRAKLGAVVPTPKTPAVDAVSSLAQIMSLARQAVAARTVGPADARRLVDLDITAAAAIQRRGSALLDDKTGLTVAQYLQLMSALTDATYGAGLLTARERAAAGDVLRELTSTPKPTRADFQRKLQEAERVVEWAQGNATLAFAEVWSPWTLLMPQVAGIRDDILRGSPLLLYGQVVTRLTDYVEGGARTRHDIFGTEVESDVRALNPGLALGRLRVAPKADSFSRDQIVALPQTPADLDPAAGILTQGEGNVLSHVQLLARALGIPNVVVGPSVYQKIKPHDGQQVFFIVTPGGRVILKDAATMTPQDHAVYDDFTRNQHRAADGSLAGGGPRLHIDRTKVDLTKNMPIDLTEVRRSDSGRFCGPKAAYLGELKHLFPDHVARGIVVPFGAYHDHYQRALAIAPDKLKSLGLTKPGERLEDFVQRTYHEFFEVMIPAGKNEQDLSAWIMPRLDVIRNSIRQTPLSPDLERAIRDGLDRDGLLLPGDKTQSVGCYVRSDTNVEDLDNFNGAGLNLTVFNRKSLADIYSGLREVWASPFEFRSFSWRQTLIDDPIWVLSSVVILESVANDKSGVLVTADVNTGDQKEMTVATSEGPSGAVDGTSAETLLWSPEGVELVTMFKSPWKNQLLPTGGSTIVPSSGKEFVLEPDELKQIVGAGQKITAELAPVKDPAGKPRPWDIEFGFKAGKLWLFQCRPFLGNDELKNIPALAPLEVTSVNNRAELLSLGDVVK